MQTQAIVGLVGSLSQLGSIALIALLMGSMFPSRRHLPWFRRWACSWPAYFVAICAIVLRYAAASSAPGTGPRTAGEASPHIWILYDVYIAGKLLYLSLLTSGARLYARRDTEPPPAWMLVAGACLVGLAIAAVSPSLNRVMFFQCLAAVPAFAACAWWLLSVPSRQRSLGSRALGVAFAAHALLWTVYGIAFGLGARLPAGHVLRTLLAFNTFVDAVLLTLLAYGMVLVVTEEATRETQQAHDELEGALAALRRSAFVDSLTGVMNRQAFDEGMGLEGIGDNPGVVVILDVDNLKPINDGLGHAAGDALLRHVADALGAGIGALDALYRWGGDEFLLVVSGGDCSQARERLARLLTAASTLRFGGLVVPARVSLGCAPFGSCGDLHDAIVRADRAMYEAKAARRPGSWQTSPMPADS